MNVLDYRELKKQFIDKQKRADKLKAHIIIRQASNKVKKLKLDEYNRLKRLGLI